MANDPNYWKSLRELYDESSVDDLKANEFMAGITDEFDVDRLSTMSRKQFLALLTASAAFAAAGCTNYRDKGEIVPYTRKPEETIPGVANSYASTCTACAQACGILIKTREGRPIKVDGNPDHPVNRGKICAKGQASILNLYDPYRLRRPQHGTGSGGAGDITWKTADAEVVRQLEAAVRKGKEIALITPPVFSPTAQRVLDEFQKKYPTATVYSYALFNDATRRRAWQACYGMTDVPAIAWDKADVILALESDFLGTDGMVMEQVREFTDRRDIMKSKNFNRLYCVEGTMSITGANADYRLRLRPDAQLAFVLSLLNELVVVREQGKPDKAVAAAIAGFSLSTFAATHHLAPQTLSHLIDDLLQHRGRSIVHAGSVLPDEIHVAVNYLNELLGNTALYTKNQAQVQISSHEDFANLVRRMKSGNVAVAIHVGTNPVYHLPRALEYHEGLTSVGLSVSLTETDDETSRLCTFVLPVHHSFESWGDYKVRRGVYSLQQPVIAPLYDTRQKEAVLLAWTKGPESFTETMYHEYLMNRWQAEVYPATAAKADFRTFWFSALHDGVVVFNEKTATRKAFDTKSLAVLTAPPATSGIVVALTENYFIGDGQFSNNGWLQEIPHPISKVVWDNYAAVSAKTAHDLGVTNNDLVEVKLPHGTVTLPVFLQPGLADSFISVSLGYGRTRAGLIGTGIGVDVTPLLTAGSLTGGRVFPGATVTKSGGTYALITTQEQHSLDDTFLKDLHLKRKIIREGTFQEYEKNPKFLHEEKTELFSIAKEVEYSGVKWAMAIDLNKCTGCNACVASCNVENNVPIVGKEQVGSGRLMHWIRIDRYYSGTDADPALSHQPMLCQHCDNAPCENVCPVSATTHSPDGLNQMVYNRCVGTKYCANNCPYKVRRFNFFNWRNHLADGYYTQDPVRLVHNPEVTVRSRGVMEKCTFCIQRIMEARQHAIEQGRPLKGNDVTTACQDACPATAIVFGDMNDANSDVSKYRTHDLGYHVLEELNVKPNVTYLARLKNVKTG